jgi:hypothetical protein
VIVLQQILEYQPETNCGMNFAQLMLITGERYFKAAKVRPLAGHSNESTILDEEKEKEYER